MPCLAVAGLLAFVGPGSGSAAAQRRAAIPEPPVSERASAVCWAPRLEGGPLRVLFIAPRATLLDAAQLADRLPLRLDIVPLWGTDRLGCPPAVEHLHPECTAEAVAANLRKRLSRASGLVVLANVSISILPDDVQDLLMARVRAGTGLLLAHHREGLTDAFRDFLDHAAPLESVEPIVRGTGHQATPEWRGGLDFVAAATVGNGRVVQLNYPGGRPLSHCLLPELQQPAQAAPEFLDNYFSLVAKAARWAAGREPSVRIDRVVSAEPAVPATGDLLPGMTEDDVRQVRATVSRRLDRSFALYLDRPAPRAYDVRVQLRQPGRNWRDWRDSPEPIARGAESHRISVSPVPGQSFLDVWVFSGGNVVDWHTEAITIEARPDFQDLRLSKDAVAPNDVVQAHLILRPLYRAGPDEPSSVVGMRAVDPWGRLVAERFHRAPADAGAFSADLGLADLLAPHVRVQVYAFSADPRRDQFADWDLRHAAFEAVSLPVRHTFSPPPFSIVVPGAGCAEYNARRRHERLRAAGVDSLDVAASFDSALYVPQAGLQPVFRIEEDWTSETVERMALEEMPADTLARAPGLEALRRSVAAVRNGATALVMVGGDGALEEIGASLVRSPGALEGFVRSLRDAFGDDIAALNANWGARFADWADLERAVEQGDDANARMALLRYTEPMPARVLRNARALAATQIPGALLGISSDVGASAPPVDWFDIARAADVFFVSPEPVTVAKLRAYRRGDTFTALRCVGAHDPVTARWLPWYALLHGFRGVAWGSAPDPSLPDGDDPLVTHDGRLEPGFAALVGETAVLRRGVATLLSRAERAGSRVAVYDSRPSLLHDAARGVSETADAQRAVVRLLEHLGVAFDFVSPGATSSHGLREYRALVLPSVRIMSDAETAAVRAFHATGGSLVADVLPGLSDEYGRPREASPLADLFGVTRGPGSADEPAPTDATVTLAFDGAPVTETLSGVAPDPACIAADAAATGVAGEFPVWFLKEHADRFALLLAHPFPDYPAPADTGSARALRKLLLSVLHRAQVTADPALSLDSGEAFPGIVARFQYGSAEILALLPSPDCGSRLKLRLEFPAGAHVHDLLAGSRVTRPRRVTANASAGAPRVFSIMPYRVNQVLAAMPESVVAGSRLPVRVRVVTDGALAQEHIVHLTLAPVSGDPLPMYSQDVVCPGGAGDAFLPLALDQAPGLYLLTARDVLTGLVHEKMVKVLPRFALSDDAG